MQLSLSSVPADSGASSLLNGLPGASAVAANDPAAAGLATAGGFAQMLAGCGTPSSGAAVPPAVAVPGAANAGPVAVFSFADPGLAPIPAVDGSATGGPAVPALPTGTCIGGVVPTATSGVGEKSSPSSSSPAPRTKDLTALGDLQALAALLAPIAPPPPDPTVMASGTAPAQADQARIDSDVAQGREWPLPSAVMALRPTFVRSPNAGSTTPAEADANAFMPVAERSSFPAAVGAEMKQAALPTPDLPSADRVPVVAGQPGGMPVSVAPEPAAAPLDAAYRAPRAPDAAPAAVPEPARVLAQMQGTEKIAAAGGEGIQRGDRTGIKIEAKSFVAPDRKALTRFNPGIGIDAAEPDATMPAGATLDRKTSSDPVVPTTAPVSETRADSMLPAAVALPSTAHRAVEAALATADRFAARDQHAVTLQFSVGGSDLNVRVELRAGEVHTTFRTDSPELRAALSSEWQAVTNQSPADRPVRLAAPVFTSAQDSGASFSGDGAARQHHQEASNAGTAYPGATSVRGSGRGNTSFGGAPTAAATAPRTAAANSVHLHTLA